MKAADNSIARAGPGRQEHVAFTYDHYGHLFPETDRGAAAKLEAIRASGLSATAVAGS